MTVPNVITRLADQLKYIYKDVNTSVLVDYNSGEIYYSYLAKGNMHTHKITVSSNKFTIRGKKFDEDKSLIEIDTSFKDSEEVVNFIRHNIACDLKLIDKNIITLLTELCSRAYDAVFEHNSYASVINIDMDSTSSLAIRYNTHNNIDRYECTVTHNGFTSDTLYLNNSFDVLCWVNEVFELKLHPDEDNIELINLFQMLYKKYLYRVVVDYDEYDNPVIDLLPYFGVVFNRYSKLDFNDNKIQCVMYDSNGPIDEDGLNLLAANSKEAMNWTIAKFTLLERIEE